MKSASALALVLALSSGCAMQPTSQWTHAHGDRAQFERDAAQCDYEATMATASYTPNSRGYRTSLGASLADAWAIGARQGELITKCLIARGYYKQAL